MMGTHPHFLNYQGILDKVVLLAIYCLFLVVEINTIVLRKANRVSGLKVGQTQIKLCQKADDMTLFLSSVKSVKMPLSYLKNFTGLQV